MQLEHDRFREQRILKNAFWGRDALPTWPACPNCNEKLAPTMLGPHVKRCRRLRPNGKPSGGTGGNDVFEGLWGVDDRPLPSMLDTLGHSLKSLVGGESPVEVETPTLGDDERQRLRILFDKFDENGDGGLSQKEHGLLLFQCFPDRVMDAKDLLAEFKTADADGSGIVSFDEFLRYYGELLIPHATSHFDEASDMFAFFDADHSGTLDQHEFLQLLNNVFPTHCDDNEAAVAAEFSAADVDGSSAITFQEFCAYYGRLRSLYGDVETPVSDGGARRYPRCPRYPRATPWARVAIFPSHDSHLLPRSQLTVDEIRAASAASVRKPPASTGAPTKATPLNAKATAPSAAKGAKKGKRLVKGGAAVAAAEVASPAAAPAADAANVLEASRRAQLDGLLQAELITPAEYDLALAKMRASAEADEARRSQLEDLRSSGLITQQEYDTKLLGNDGAVATAAAAELVQCEGCGERFLPELRPKHQRSCSAVAPQVKKVVKFVERPLPRPEDLYSSDAPEPVEVERTSVAYAANGSNSFVNCGKCGRSFFPDRLPVHLRACKGKGVGQPSGAGADPKRKAQLDELLATGLITRVEYDAKLSALLPA